ncbi:MAG: hypothetical protein AAGC93_10060 [Cyanobacteria bacterium P01_F01_bin.53]
MSHSLAALNNTTLLTIGQTDSNNTITLKDSLKGSVGNRPLINIVGGDSIVGLENTKNVFRVTGTGSGNLLNTDVVFSSIENLSGGRQNDSFEFIDNGKVLGSINGADGLDSLDYRSTTTTPIQIDLANMSATGATSFTDIENIFGSSANSDRILGTVANDTFIATGSSSGRVNETLTFSSIEELNGNTGRDTLSYAEYNTAITVDIDNMSATDVANFSNIETIVGSSTLSDHIKGSSENDIFSITADSAGTVNGLLSFSEIEMLDAIAGNDTLDYSSFSTDITVNLQNSNATGLAAFKGIENIIGSSANHDQLTGFIGNDTFALTSDSTGNINGGLSFSAIERIDGNLGEDVLDYRNYGESISIDLERRSATGLSEFINIETILGSNNDRDQIVGSAGNDTFALTNINTGKVNNFLSFSQIETLQGGTGTDTLSYRGYGSAIAVDLENNSASGLSEFGSIENIVGSRANNDKIMGSTENDTFEITNNAIGNINNSFAFSAIEILEGNDGDDTLSYRNYDSEIEVDLENNRSTGIAQFHEIEEIIGSRFNTDTIRGSASNDTFGITGIDSGLINNRLAFSNVEDFDGGEGVNTLSLNDSSIGSDRTWVIDGINRGIVNELTFDNFSILLGSTGRDTFTLTDEGQITGAINGNEGIDTLDYSSYEEEVKIDAGLRKATGIAAFNSIEEVVGSPFTESVIEGSNSDDTFVITGDGSGRLNDRLTFRNINRMDGQGGNNTLTINSPTTGISNDWVINGDNRGSINNLPFQRIRNITGGDSNDTFRFVGTGKLGGTVEGGGGIDTVDYSQYTLPISVNLTEMSTTSGSTLLSTLNNIERIEGTGAETDRIIGTATNDIFEITDEKRGNINNDIEFSDIEILNGGLGSDSFRLNDLTTASNITIIGGNDFTNGLPSNQIISDGSNTTWHIDATNQGS